MDKTEGFVRFLIDRYLDYASGLLRDSLMDVRISPGPVGGWKDEELERVLEPLGYVRHAWSVEVRPTQSYREPRDEDREQEEDQNGDQEASDASPEFRPTYVIRTPSGFAVCRFGEHGYVLESVPGSADQPNVRRGVYDVRLVTPDQGIRAGVVAAAFRRDAQQDSRESEKDDSTHFLEALCKEPAFVETVRQKLSREDCGFVAVGRNAVGNEFFYDLHWRPNAGYYVQSTADCSFYHRNKEYGCFEWTNKLREMIASRQQPVSDAAIELLIGNFSFEPKRDVVGSRNEYPLLYGSERMADLSVVLEGKEFRLHRIVLLTESRMFDGMIEKNPNATLLVCGPNDFAEGERVGSDEFADLVRFWYLKELPPDAATARKLRVLYLVELFDRTVS